MNGSDEFDAPVCVPLCGAARAYRYPQWWQHEALCPVRIDFLRRRDGDMAEDAEHAKAAKHSGRKDQP